jgi:hypothetical protein
MALAYHITAGHASGTVVDWCICERDNAMIAHIEHTPTARRRIAWLSLLLFAAMC